MIEIETLKKIFYDFTWPKGVSPFMLIKIHKIITLFRIESKYVVFYYFMILKLREVEDSFGNVKS